MEKVTGVKQLKLIANTIRQDLIKMLAEAKSGHSAGPLGMTEVFTALYFNVLNHDPKNPSKEDRDRLLLSNGHICPIRYAAMANSGYFPKEELMTLRKLGTRLQGHPHNTSLAGVENTSGPLGQGSSQACGFALAAKMDNKKHHVFCILGDGEINEGQIWEAFMFSGKNKLNNLTFIIDRNNIQIDGFTEDVMPLEPLREKLESFGLHVIETDGHNIQHVIDACNEAKSILEKPSIIIAHTIPGKGISFMEKKYQWHGKPPTPEQAEVALKELEEERKKIESE
ncbi:MAG: transketolase [Candidatus Micrarchaeia archaeon]